MIKKATFPSYEQASKLFKQADSPVNAADIHGLLCGWISAGTRVEGQPWFESALDGVSHDPAIFERLRDLILRMYEFSFIQLNDLDAHFTPLLPADDTDLGKRAQALSSWCQGFIYGLGLAQVEIEDARSEDVREALYHIAEISKMDYDDMDVREEDELAFNEVLLYIRDAVMQIHHEFSQPHYAGESAPLHPVQERVLH